MTTNTMTAKTAEAALAAQIRSRLEAKASATHYAWSLLSRQYEEAMRMAARGTLAEHAAAKAKLAELLPARAAAADADRNAYRELDTFCRHWGRCRDARGKKAAAERAAFLQRYDEISAA